MLPAIIAEGLIAFRNALFLLTEAYTIIQRVHKPVNSAYALWSLIDQEREMSHNHVPREEAYYYLQTAAIMSALSKIINKPEPSLDDVEKITDDIVREIHELRLTDDAALRTTAYARLLSAAFVQSGFIDYKQSTILLNAMKAGKIPLLSIPDYLSSTPYLAMLKGMLDMKFSGVSAIIDHFVPGQAGQYGYVTRNLQSLMNQLTKTGYVLIADSIPGYIRAELASSNQKYADIYLPSENTVTSLLIRTAFLPDLKANHFLQPSVRFVQPITGYDKQKSEESQMRNRGLTYDDKLKQWVLPVVSDKSTKLDLLTKQTDE